MRITNKDLENAVQLLNEVTNSPLKPWENGKSNIGNYHISSAYGGVALHKVSNEHGGIRDILGGYGTKKELYYKIHAFIDGVEIGKNI